MNVCWTDACKNLESVSKANAEQLASRSSRMIEFFGEGCRVWFAGLTAALSETTAAVESLGKSKTAAEVLDIQRALMEKAIARQLAGLKSTTELGMAMLAELSAPVSLEMPAAAPVATTAVVAAPVATAPVVAAPVVETPVVETVVPVAAKPAKAARKASAETPETAIETSAGTGSQAAA